MRSKRIYPDSRLGHRGCQLSPSNLIFPIATRDGRSNLLLSWGCQPQTPSQSVILWGMFGPHIGDASTRMRLRPVLVGGHRVPERILPPFSRPSDAKKGTFAHTAKRGTHLSIEYRYSKDLLSGPSQPRTQRCRNLTNHTRKTSVSCIRVRTRGFWNGVLCFLSRQPRCSLISATTMLLHPSFTKTRLSAGR